MTIATCDLIDAFFPELLDLERVWLHKMVIVKKSILIGATYLEWIAIAVFWHLTYDAAAVTELSHFSTTPGV